MDRFSSSFIGAMFTPFSSEFIESNSNSSTFIPKSIPNSRFSPYIYNGRRVSGSIL